MTGLGPAELVAGAILVGGSPEDFPKYFAAESAKWRDLIKKQNIKVQ